MYCREKGSFKMPSLMLWPNGPDRSKISHHFPGWRFLGITPKQLMWRFGIGEIRKGHATWPFWSSESRYWSIPDGWRDADSILWTAEEPYQWSKYPAISCQGPVHQGVKTMTKTTPKTCNRIIHFHLIGVKTKFTSKFLSINGGSPRRKDQILQVLATKHVLERGTPWGWLLVGAACAEDTTTLTGTGNKLCEV